MARSQDNLNAVFQDTANAIRAKKGSTNEICPRDFADEVASIQTGITPTGTLNITENDVYDVTNYASANVSVPSATYTQYKLYYAYSTTGVDLVSGANAGHICYYLGSGDFVDGGVPGGNDLYVVDKTQETLRRYSISGNDGDFAYANISYDGLVYIETCSLQEGESTEIYVNNVKFTLTRDSGGGSGFGSGD